MSEARVVELILTSERRGRGTEEDPMRLVPQLWTRDGQLVCEADHVTKVETCNLGADSIRWVR